MLMKGGTCTTSPVSVRAGFTCALAVAPLMPGTVSSTRRSTVTGRSMPTGSSVKLHLDDRVRQDVVDGVAEHLAIDVNLLERSPCS